jgi:hypothetical protein
MQWSDIPFDPPRRTLRQFAGAWLIFFSLASLWQAFVRENFVAALILTILAVTVGPLGLVWPRAVRVVFVAAMVVTFPIGWLVSRLVLAIIFYAVFTPVALVFRVLGRDALALRRCADSSSYWTAKSMPADPRQYLRQF